MDNGNLEPERATLAHVGLMLFNASCCQLAFERRLDEIDLRLVCADPSDSANAIEPSGSDGRKIARARARAVGASEPGPVTRVVA